MAEENKKNYGLSLIRLLSVLLIFICHVFQKKDDLIAFYLNIGVQIFLIMSGYLNSKSSIISVKRYYCKRFNRILIPYYLWLIVTILVNISQGIHVDKWRILSSLFCLQWVLRSVQSCGHLWYITCILICYLLTPILYKISNSEHGIKKALFSKIGIMTIIILLILGHVSGVLHGYLVMIELYCFGYFWGGAFGLSNYLQSSRKMYLLSVGGTLIFVLMFLFENKGVITYPFWLFTYVKGIIAFLWFQVFYKIRNLPYRLQKVLDITDRYSFHFYLTHHMFVLGGLSTPIILHFKVFAVPFSLLCSGLSAFALEKISGLIEQKIHKGEDL